MYIEIERIFDSCIENNLPVPKYAINLSNIMIEFVAPQRLVIDTFSKVNDRINRVLKLLYDDPGYTITELANLIGISRKSVSNIMKS